MNDRMEELRSPLEKYRERIEAQRKDPAYREEVNRKLAEMYACVSCCDEGARPVEVEGEKRWVTVPCDDCAEVRALAEAGRQLSHRRRYADLPGYLAHATFDSFKFEGDSVRREAWNHAQTYAAQGVGSRPWLVMLSRPGTGKTHLAAAIANYRVHHRDLPQAKFLEVPTWLNRLRRGFGDGTYDDTLDLAMSAPCLVVDDFGAEYHRARQGAEESWASEQLYLVINYRYVRRMETVITSNTEVKRLPPRLADRIGDTGTKLVRTVTLETTSYRTAG